MEGVTQKKSFIFGLRVVKLYRYLTEQKREYIISKQVLRSGTSIGANTAEAVGGQSRADFYAKICIAYKEAIETVYWLKLLYGAGYISAIEFNSIFKDCEELCKLLGKTKATIKK